MKGEWMLAGVGFCLAMTAWLGATGEDSKPASGVVGVQAPRALPRATDTSDKLGPTADPSASSGGELTSRTPSTRTLGVSSTAAASFGVPEGLGKRPWNLEFLSSLGGAQPGEPVEFELVNGAIAVGTIRHSRLQKEQLIYVSGELREPEPGHFFFQKQTEPGVAGSFVGVIELPNRQRAYRIEPSGLHGAPELVERPLESVICTGLPRPPSSRERLEKAIPLKLSPTELPIPWYQQGIVVLESLPGAGAVIYLDFAGGFTASWGGIAYARPDVSNDEIREVWARVAEDFRPFNINVTTDLQVYQQARQGRRQRAIITPTDTASPLAGGVSYIGSFNWTGEIPCWVFMICGKDCAEACSHELGHTLGLSHDGQLINQVNTMYYRGHGCGETRWAPIMGIGYDANVTQWSKGEYLHANNNHDQLQMISTCNNGVAYRFDDTGDTLATSRYLEVYADGTAQAEGVIERTADTDAFQFTTEGGWVCLRAEPAPVGPDSAVQATLCDATDTILAVDDGADRLWASLTTNLPPGTYTFRVTGTGRKDPLSSGFSSYASLGRYSITGTVFHARLPNRFAITEHAANGTVLGKVPPKAESQTALAFEITSGNTGNTFAIDSSGTLTVADNTLLDCSLLASQMPSPVHFELFVDIVDLKDRTLSEKNRRLVITVLPAPPTITRQPLSQEVLAGQDVLLTVEANGAAPIVYQWIKDGTNLAKDIFSQLSIHCASRRNAGSYAVVVSGPGGSVRSDFAVVRVISAQRLQNASRLSDASFRIVSRDSLGVALLPAEVAAFRLEVSTNLVDWSALGIEARLTDGALVLIDCDATNCPTRFYRIVERGQPSLKSREVGHPVSRQPVRKSSN